MGKRELNAKGEERVSQDDVKRCVGGRSREVRGDEWMRNKTRKEGEKYKERER